MIKVNNVIALLIIVLSFIALSEQKKYITANVGDIHFVYENDVCTNGVKTFCDGKEFSMVLYSDKETCEKQVGSITIPNVCKKGLCQCTDKYPDGFRLVFYDRDGCESRRPETIVISDDLCFSVIDTLLIDLSLKFEIDKEEFSVSAYLEEECENDPLVTVTGKLKQCSKVNGQSFVLSSGYSVGISSFLVVLSLLVYMF